MASATKATDGNRTELTVVGGVLAVVALILCVTALLFSGNPLYFVFGVTAVSLAAVVASLVDAGGGR
jgi:hypothetical protein